MSSTINLRASKRRRTRRRRPPSHFAVDGATAAEERFLQQAIQNSKIDRGRPADGKLNVPWGPVFYPTVQDFEGNPLHYVEKIRPIAEMYGICKIVPPKGWNPPFCADLDNTDKKFQTKQQLLHRLQEGISFGDGADYTAAEYQRVAGERSSQWKAERYPDHDLLSRHSQALLVEMKANDDGDDKEKKKKEENSNNSDDEHNNKRRLYTAENLERDYWEIVETHSKEVVVEYANDIDTQEYGSGFPLSERGRSITGTCDPAQKELPEPAFGTDDYYKETWWNVNNIPCAPDSALHHVKVGINGINVPWMYYGSLFATFCWHNEDNYLYSINYHHAGAPKQWYGVPGTKQAADGLERVFKSYLSMKMRDCPDLLHHITTMFSPRLLQNAAVPVCKLIQYEGEFVVTFPRAFHSGFSYGPNCGEAVNFATHDWIAHGSDANERYRSFARPAVFSHDRLTCTMANHLREQTSYGTCKLLLQELERVAAEELQLRAKLHAAGVRDVSHLITLPENRLDQLDETSANYDDKRLCFACKHICFFSAVACECSQSKVSCLRHSHYMCRCTTDRKYFMIWSKDSELKETLERVRSHCETLLLRNSTTAAEGDGLGKEKDDNAADVVDSASSTKLEAEQANDKKGQGRTPPPQLLPPTSPLLPAMAPGAATDLNLHKNDEIRTKALLKSETAAAAVSVVSRVPAAEASSSSSSSSALLSAVSRTVIVSESSVGSSSGNHESLSATTTTSSSSAEDDVEIVDLAQQ